MGNKISIIIPTYNSIKYIKECLDSINSQNYDNYEVIIVDDGSFDGTVDIINEYVSLNNRFKLFIKENGGVSSARNYGLTKVTGDYILFVDSDDYLASNEVINNLILNIQDTDIIRFGSIKLTNNKLLKEDINSFKNDYKNGEAFIQDALNINKKYSWYLWQYLFKKEFWEGISFPVDKIFEDTATIYKVLLKANKIKVIKDNYYVYRYNPVSLSKKINLKICLDMIDIINETAKNIKNLNVTEETKKMLLNNISYGYITDINVLYLLDLNDRDILREKILDNKYLLDYCLYDKEVIIKYLVKIFGVDIISKMLNVRRILWKK